MKQVKSVKYKMGAKKSTQQNRIWRTRRFYQNLAPLLCLLWINVVTAQDCTSPTFNFDGSTIVNEAISLLDINVAIARHTVSNVRTVLVESFSGSNLYISATLNDATTELVISTNAAFADFPKVELIPTLYSVLQFTCGSGASRSIRFQVPVKEENLYNPSFGKAEYTIELPLPLPKGFDLTQYVDGGSGIKAYDYDMTGNEVSFTLTENAFFLVERLAGPSVKESIARLRTKNTLTRLEDDFSITITGTDAGSPPRSGTALLKISGDPLIPYVEPPQFQQSLYKTTYKVTNAFVPIEVNLQSNTFDSTITYQLSGDNAAWLTITPKDDRSGASVTLRSDAVMPETTSFISAIVTASRTGAELTGRTAIVVEIEREVKQLPAFAQSIYAGEVDQARVITLSSTIKLVTETTTGATVEIKLVGEDAEFFMATYSDNTISIAASEKLTEDLLKERFYFHFTIEAVKAGVGSGIAFVVLEVQREDEIIPKFEQLYYEGNVTELGVGIIPAIQIVENVVGMSFTYTGDNDLFTIVNDQNKISLTPNDITEEKLNDRSYLLVKISASLEQVVVAETIVIVKVIREAIIVPEFTQNFLQGQLTEKSQELTPIKVTIVSKTFSSSTVVSLRDSSNLFELKKTTISNEFTINLRAGVTIPSDTHFTLIVDAINPKSTTTNCFVLIDVLRVPVVTPEFEQLLYEGQIDSSSKLQELKLKLKPETYDATISFNLIDNDAALFQSQKLETNELLITFKDSTTEEDIANRNNLRFNVRAVKPETPGAIVPVVVFIQKADVKLPKFEKPLYKSSIGTDLRLVPFETIQLVEGTGAEGLEIEVLLNNTNHFEASISDETKVLIRLKGELTAADVEGFERFEFVVEVRNPGVGSTFATIVVDIMREAVIVPLFTEVAYSGVIQEGSREMNFAEKITLKDDTITEEVKYFILGEDSGIVEMATNQDLSLKFALKAEVTVDQLKSKHQINFVVQATNPGSTETTASIVVRIVRPVRAVFSKSSFTGTLKEGQNMADFVSDKITLLDDTFLEGTSFSMTGSDSVLFDVKTEEQAIQLSLRSTVNWIQIRHRTYLSFMLEATNPGADPASVTIIINVENNPVVTPVFTKTFYRGSLQKGLHDVSFAASEVITLDSETITNTLTFQAIDNDHEMFEVTRDNNKFKVTLKETVDEATIEGRDILSFLIEANNEFGATDTTTVLVSIQLDVIIAPLFTATIYKGSIKEGTTELRMPTEITFQPETLTDFTEVGVAEGDSEWFTVKITDSKAVISVKSDSSIQWESITDRLYLSFLIQATNPASSSATAFIVLNIERTEIVTPKFKASSFQGYLEQGSRNVQFPPEGVIELDQNTLLPGYTTVLVDNDYQLFDQIMEGNQVRITLKSDITDDDLTDKQYLRFSVAVTNLGSATATAAVVVDLKRDTVPVVTPLFEKLTYRGTIDSDFSLSLRESIVVTEGTYSEDVVFSIVDSNSDLLKVEKKEREAVVLLSRSVTAEDLLDVDNLHVTIQATNEQAAKSLCVLIVSLPVEDPEICTPTPPVIECTDCYNCTTGEPLDDVPVFAYGNYRFFLKSDTVGVVGVVRASQKDSSATLVHRVTVDNGYLKSRISLSTEGVLRILEPLLPNHYTFQVIALNPTSAKQSTVSVLLEVTQDQECPADPEAPKITTVEKLLVIQSLAEEETHSNIFPSQLGDCDYELIDEHPFQDYSYFEIDSSTHWLTSLPFDRENETLFEGMTTPQFQLRLRLVCPGQQDALAQITKRSLIETEDLNFSRDVTVVNVIVIDVNDNDPHFIVPMAGQNIHLGFPVSTIASGLMLPQLITVQADDLDAGLNAKIRYSLAGNADFGIDPEGGMIYPMKNAMKANSLISLVVTATDRDGASDGRISQVTLSVHRLAEDHLVMMTVMGQTDATAVVDKINANANGVLLKVLVQARVPHNDDSKSGRQSATEDTVLRLIVYAFNSRNELQDSEVIERTIRSAALTESVAIDSYSNAACPECQVNHGSSDSTNVGLIASTSVLGVLFLISAGMAVFLYLRFVRPLSSTSANPSDIVQLENDFDISPPPSPATLGAKKVLDSPESDERKISIQITGITDQESEDSRYPTTHQLARSLDDRLEEGDDEFGTVSSRATLEDTSLNEPRNVKFNELVERIEVVEHHPERDDIDNRSVYSERM